MDTAIKRIRQWSTMPDATLRVLSGLQTSSLTRRADKAFTRIRQWCQMRRSFNYNPSAVLPVTRYSAPLPAPQSPSLSVYAFAVHQIAHQLAVTGENQHGTSARAIPKLNST